MTAPFNAQPLQIITADQRMKERRGIKGVLTGISGMLNVMTGRLSRSAGGC